MRHEKIIKREDGTKYEIHVSFWLDYNKPNYDISVYKCEKGKRKFFNLHSSDDIWRSLNKKEREEYKTNLYLKEVTPEEIQAAKLEFWHKLKP